MRATLPPNIRLWRRKSGWVTKEMMREILKELCATLGELTTTHQVVLLLDTASVHICPLFLRAASRKGIMVQYIPAKLTWLLQPLDAHVFARFKRYLLQEYRLSLQPGEAIGCDLTSRVQSIIKACRHVLQAHAWAYAFDANGFSTCAQSKVRQTILDELEWERVPELPASLPTVPEFMAIFPTRRDIPLSTLLLPYRDHTDELPAAPLLDIVEPIDPEERPNPWFGRLRSSIRLSLAPPPLEGPPPLPPPHQVPADIVPPPPPPAPPIRPKAPPRLFPVGRPLRLPWRYPPPQ